MSTRFHIICLTLSFLLSVAVLLASTPEIDEWAPRSPDEFHNFEGQRYVRALERGERDPLDWEFDDDFDVTYYHLTLDVRDYVGRTVYGNVIMNAAILTGGVDSLDVEFCSTLILDSIVSAEMGTLSFVHENHHVAFDLGRSYNQGETISVHFYYHGTPCQVNSQWSFWYYTRAVGPNNIPAVHTLSESTGARDWWPCKDVPADKADSVRVTVICADSLTATSNGVLESTVALPPSSKAVTWFESYPIATYLVTLNVTNYRQFNGWYIALNGDSVPINHYTYPERYTQALVSWSNLPLMMSMLAHHFGEYPFVREKYGHTMNNYPGGMEHQCNTSYGRALTTGSHFYDYVVAHEAAHMWWGDCVTNYDWPDIWLNEGFASYCEALWMEQLFGIDSLRGYQMSPGGNDVVDPSGPVYNPTILFSGNTVYDKGSWILHMLRGAVRDDSLFFAIFDEYRNRHEYSVAATIEFLDAASDVCGFDVTPYLYAYLYRTNRPIYRVAYGSGELDGQPRTIVRIRQVQTDPDTTFTTRLDLSFNNRAALETVENSKWVESYNFELGFAPSSLTVDPDNWVLKAVSEEALPASILNTELDTAYVQQSYAEQLVAVGGTAPYVWSLIGGRLPGDFTFHADGRITSLVVSNPGQYPLQIRVTDQTGAADTMDFVLTTDPLIITPSNLTVYPVSGAPMVRLMWKHSGTADSFRVWRSTDLTMSNPELIGSTTRQEFLDSTAVFLPDTLNNMNRSIFYSVTAVRNE